MLFFFAFLLIHAPGTALSTGMIDYAPAAVIANALLPPQAANRTADVSVHRSSWVPSYRVWMSEAAEPDGRLCRRLTHLAYLAPQDRGADASADIPLHADEDEKTAKAYVQLAVRQVGQTEPESCRADGRYINVEARNEGAAAGAMGALVEARRLAISRQRHLPFAVTCEGGTFCGNPRAALASLDWRALVGISFEHEVPVPLAALMTISREVPKPIVVQEPTIQFGMSSPDGRSWKATLTFRSGKLAAIALASEAIIWH